MCATFLKIIWMYLSSCLMGLFGTAYYYFTWINLIIFYEWLISVMRVDWDFYFLKDDIGLDWYFFYNCRPESFYTRFCVFLASIIIFAFLKLDVCGRLESKTVPTKFCLIIYTLLMIDFEENWRLKLFPVWVISLCVLFDYFSSTRDYYFENPLKRGRFFVKRSAEGILFILLKVVWNFSTLFSSLVFV